MCPGGAVVAHPIAFLKRGFVDDFAVAGAAFGVDPAIAGTEGDAGGEGVVFDFDFEAINSGLLGFGVEDVFPADDAALIPLPPSP